MTRTLYDRMRFTARIPFVVFWLLAGLLLFIGNTVLVNAFRGPAVDWRQIAVASVAVTWVFVGWHGTALMFGDLMHTLDSVVELPEGVDAWVSGQTKKLFTLSTWPAWLTSLLFCFAATGTMLVIGLPFRSEIVNALVLVELQFLLIVCGHGAYFYMGLLWLLYKVVRYPLKETFYRVDNPAVRAVNQFYASVTLIIIIAYALLILAIWQSPFGLSSYMAVWPTVLAFYPLAYFVWSSLQVHHLMYRIKQSNIDLINQQIVAMLQKVRGNPTKETAELLSQLMSVQKDLEALREWPYTAQGIITFILSAATPVLQLVSTAIK